MPQARSQSSGAAVALPTRCLITAAFLAGIAPGTPARADWTWDGYTFSFAPGEAGEGEIWPMIFCANETGCLAVGQITATPFFVERVLSFPTPPAGVTGVRLYPDPYVTSDSDAGAVELNPPTPGPTAPPPLNQNQKQHLNHAGYYMALTAGGFAYAGYLLPNPGAAAVAGAAAALFGILSATFFYAGSGDPPDPNYQQIATPVPYTPVPDLTGAGRCLVKLESALTIWIGYAGALETSVNRYYGAMAAGDAYWADRQLQAVQYYDGVVEPQLTQLENALPGGLACLPVLPSPALSVADFENGLAANGMPDPLLQGYNSVGIAPTVVDTALLDTQDQTLTSYAFLALFGPPTTRQAYWSMLVNNAP
jgi:hypothetical protein